MGYGKTSILKAAQARASAQKSIVLHFHAEAYATLEELIAAVLSEATSQLNTNLNKTREKVNEFFGRQKKVAVRYGCGASIRLLAHGSRPCAAIKKF